MPATQEQDTQRKFEKLPKNGPSDQVPRQVGLQGRVGDQAPRRACLRGRASDQVPRGASLRGRTGDQVPHRESLSVEPEPQTYVDHSREPR